MHLSMLSQRGGGGGRANNVNLIVKSVPRVEFSILRDVPRVGNLITRDRGLKAIFLISFTCPNFYRW